MFSKRRLLLTLFSIPVVGIIVLIWRPWRPRIDVQNVILISLDTCRADRLACYGYPRPTTPHLDDLASQSTLFTDVLAPVPMTLPSHCTMLTGTNPPYHGVHDNLNNRLTDSNVTLAEILGKYGFVTGAVVSAFVLNSQFGLDQGFDDYNDHFKQKHEAVGMRERKGDEATRIAVEWIEQHQDERFFFLLHYFDPHFPYEAPEPFAARFPSDPYAAEIAYTDHCVGQVIDQLKQLGLYESTLVIVVGDHGEMLGEHGESTHMYFIYQAAMRVPMIIKVPGQTTTRRINDPVGIIDIVPTVCSVLNIDIPSQVRGENLSTVFRGGQLPQSPRYRYCESVTPTNYGANSLLGIMDDRWKFISTTRPELYDLSQDPQELNNLSREQPRRARRLQDELYRIIEDQFRDDVGADVTLDSGAVRQLESIGYVGGETEEGALEYYDQPAEWDDPKDLIAFHRKLQQVLGFQALENLDRARELCLQLVDERPSYVQGHYKLAEIAVDQQSPATAIGHLNRVISLDGKHFQAHKMLGNLLLDDNNYDEAITNFVRAIEIDPTKPEVFSQLGAALAGTGKTDDAVAHYRMALELVPDLAQPRVNLGVALAAEGKTQDAIIHYLRAIELAPEYADAHYNLGRAYEAEGNLDEAIKSYQQTLELDSKYAEAHLNLGELLGRERKMQQCEHHFREALRIQPDYALAHYNLARTLHGLGRVNAAMQHYRAATDLKPDDARAHYRYGQALMIQENPTEAISHYRTALRLRPEWAAVLGDMAWCLAARPDWPVFAPDEALPLAQRAAEISNQQDANLLDTLAIAQAAAGQFEAAIASAKQALTLEPAAHNQRIADEIRAKLKLYEQKKPYQASKE